MLLWLSFSPEEEKASINNFCFDPFHIEYIIVILPSSFEIVWHFTGFAQLCEAIVLPSFFSDRVLAVFLAEPAADITAALVTGGVFLWRFPKILDQRERQLRQEER